MVSSLPKQESYQCGVGQGRVGHKTGKKGLTDRKNILSSSQSERQQGILKKKKRMENVKGAP